MNVYRMICVLLIVVLNCEASFVDRINAYLAQNGYEYKEIDYLGAKKGACISISDDGSGSFIELWDVDGVARPEESDLPTEENAAAILEAHRQASKTVLHKAADNALIRVLIRGGFLPEGTTEVPDGTEASVTAQLLQAEVLDPTNSVIQELSTKLDRIKTIIKEENGSPDDAIVHE